MEYKVGGTPTFADWSVTFLADENHVLRTRMLGWQAQIFDAQRQLAGSPVNYKADNICSYMSQYKILIRDCSNFKGLSADLAKIYYSEIDQICS